MLSHQAGCGYCSLERATRFLPTKQPEHSTVQHIISSFIMWFQLQELQDFKGKRDPRGARHSHSSWTGEHILAAPNQREEGVRNERQEVAAVSLLGSLPRA